MFHVYVDPIFGDDESAWELNPGNPLDSTSAEPNLDGFCRWPNDHRPLPLDTRDQVNANNMPYWPTNPNYAMTGYLQHAPYSFRTLTGLHGAIEYVCTLFDDPARVNPPAPLLPWLNPQTGMTVTHVVIHCLPGLYGPRNPLLPHGTPDVDAVTGLPWNGEVFPVELGGRPNGLGRLGLFDRVSIQGTSALDTIFDGRAKDSSLPPATRSSNIFEVRSHPISFTIPGPEHAGAFIDGITIRNATSLEGGGSGHGIGIRLMGTGHIRLTVTNCFFVDNVVGIALDAFGIQDLAVPRWGVHEPLLVNNTFVGNQVSIWSGEVEQDYPPPTLPYQANNHDPLVINNILRGVVSGFEGLQAAALQAAIVDGVALPSPVEFNAWIPTLTNLGFIPTVPNWANASTGFATPPNLGGLQPRVDLTNLHNIFVRDLLAGAVGTDDHHDYRLSPNASNDLKTPPGQMNPLLPNPLIGAGVNRALPGISGLGIASSGGIGFANAPGLPAGTEEAPINAWDYDCEGFGNMRLLPRDGILPNPLPQYGTIDIGADQCGGLIMAGYLPSTRMYVGEVPGSGLTIYDRAYFVEEPNQTGFPRPLASWILGGLPWYDNVQAAPITQTLPCPSGPLQTYYTEGFFVGGLQTARYQLNQTGSIGPFPRNLACDFSPHLLADVHPFWGQRFADFATPLGGWPLADPFACNPHYHSPWDISVSPLNETFYPDNPALFHNRTFVAPHGIAVWPQEVLTSTWVWDAHLNPPGTLFIAGGPLHWLPLPSSPFGPFAPCGQATFDTSQWGLNDACPDPLPPAQLDLGVRINCNLPATGTSIGNLQSFLILMNAGGTMSSQSSPWPSAANSQLGPRVSLSRLLNLPAWLGTEADYEIYQRVVRSMPGVVR
ncbi:MAG: hypothetical protein KDC98_14790 [Planctomycetes bacterium]|nr:hypothetical protein [Planctomycetota bacterium]